MTTETKTRDTMTLVQRYELMHLVKTEHGKGKTDAEFAAYAQERLGFRVLPATVSGYREAFGLPQTKLAKPSELRARIRELEERLAQQAKADAPSPDQAAPATTNLRELEDSAAPVVSDDRTVQIGGRTLPVPGIRHGMNAGGAY